MEVIESLKKKNQHFLLILVLLHYFYVLYNTYLTKEYSSHPESEISILGHQHQCEGEMVLQDSSAQLVTLP